MNGTSPCLLLKLVTPPERASRDSGELDGLPGDSGRVVEVRRSSRSLHRLLMLAGLLVSLASGPLVAQDADGDGITDTWEAPFGLSSSNPDDADWDPDQDDLTNLEEFQNDTNPLIADTDGDGIADGAEVADGTEPDDPDSDDDGMWDGFEVSNGLDPGSAADATLDGDADQATNLQEFQAGTDPGNPDTDGDGIPDGVDINPLVPDADQDGIPDEVEVQFGLDPQDGSDAALDPDGDGLTSLEEFEVGTSPLVADSDFDGVPDGIQFGDTDGDGLTDGYEMENGLDPAVDDAGLDGDGDGLTNLEEFQQGTDPDNPDTDLDGLNDGDEVSLGTLPLDNDTDSDGVLDGDEVTRGIDPRMVDSDGDGLPDNVEIQNGLDPAVPDSLLDPDGDGRDNFQEVQDLTDPTTAENFGDLTLDETCTVSVLNRTVRVNPDGTFALPNVPAAQGLLRARVTCERDGFTLFGQSELFQPVPNDDTPVGEISLQVQAPLPVRITIRSASEILTQRFETTQLLVEGTFADGNVGDFTNQQTGTSYIASNFALADIGPDGLYTVLGNGTVIVTAKNEGAISTTVISNLLGDDSDGDGIPDELEEALGLDPDDPSDAQEDLDGDGLSNFDEIINGTDIAVRDTDGDGLLDGDEIGRGTNPLAADSDLDGLLDRDEILRGTDPLLADSDGDGLSDGTEVALGLDPRSEDSDGDQISDAEEDTDGDSITNVEELVEFTDPGDPDTDGDGIQDGEELVAGADGFVTDPLDPDSDDDGMVDGCETACAGLDPNDPLDALGDLDEDGLDNLQECQGETSPCEENDIEGPLVVDVTPADGAVDVSPSSSIVITFDEPVSPSTVNSLTIVVFAGTERIPASYSRSGDNLAVTVNASLVPERVHTLFVTRDLSDVLGNAAAPFSLEFTTGPAVDTGRPVIAVMRPAHGATGIDVSKCVTAFFSEPIDPTTVTAESFRLRRGNTNFSGTTVVDSDGLSATICPDVDFDYNQSYNLRAETSIRDLAGNPLNAFQGNFQTARNPADTRPLVIAVRPASNSTDVPTNFQVIARFSEAIEPVTVTPASFRVTLDGVDIPGTLSLESGNTVVRLVPDDPQPPATQFRLQASGIEDLAGNTMSPTLNYLFTTGDGPDDRAPSLVSFSPLDGSDLVGTNAMVALRFSESLHPATLNLENIVVRDDQDGVAACSLQVLREDRVALFIPQEPLRPETEYTVSLTSSIVDGAGNALSPTEFTFTTGPGPDVVAPVVVTSSPIQGGTDVPLNARLAWSFSRPLSPVFIDPISFPVNQSNRDISGGIQASDDLRLVYLTPDEELVPSAGHRMRALRREVRDLTGNLLNHGGGDFFSTWNTGEDRDLDGPSVLSVNPPDGTTGVGVNSPVILDFDEVIDATAVASGSIQVLRGDEVVEGTYRLAVNLREVHFRPLEMLERNTAYRVEVIGSDLTDLSGNASSSFTSAFTTGSTADVKVPTVISISPFSGEQGVPTDAPISVLLSEPVNPISVHSETFRVTSSGDHPGSLSFSPSRRRVTFVPARPYPVGSTISVRIRREIVDDAGNRLNNGSDFFSSFQTRFLPGDQAPRVLITSPFDRDVQVGTDAVVAVEFDQSIDATSLDPGTFAVRANGIPVAGTFALEESQRVVRFTPDRSLPQSTEVQVILDGIRAVSGVPLATIETISFTTRAGPDTVAPTVVFVTPQNRATEVPLDGQIRITFSETLDETTLDPATVRFTGSGTPPLLYEIEVDSLGRRVTLLPERQLLPDVPYSIFLDDDIRDRSGNPLGGARSFSFTTGRQGDSAGPLVVTTNPGDGFTNIGSNTSIQVEFDEIIDPTSVTRDTFRVTGGLVEVLGDFSMTGGGRIAVLTPFSLLRSGVEHRVVIDGILDRSGNPMVPHEFTFSTASVGNVAVTEGVLLEASSQNGGWPARQVNDGNLQRSWFVAAGDESPSIELIFLEDITLREIRLFNPRDFPTGFDFLTGSVTLMTGDRTVLWESGVFSFDEGEFQDKTLAIPEVEGVRRILFVGETWESNQPALAEISLLGHFADPQSGIPDLEVPRVLSSVPVAEATGVSVNPEVTVTFSKPMNPTTFDAQTCRLQISGIGDFPVTRELGSEGRILTVEPTAPLPPSSRIVLFISSGVRGVNGNPLERNFSTSFTTEETVDVDAPEIVSINPPDGTLDVRTTQPVTLIFDEPLSPPTVNGNNFAVFSGGQRVNVSISRGQDNTSVVLRGNWTSNAVHTIYVSPEVTDLGGNSLPLIRSTFTTSGPFDLVRPVVLAYRPPTGSTGIEPDHPVHVFLNEPLDAGTVAGSFYLATDHGRGGQLVAGTREISQRDQLLSFFPDEALDHGQIYRVHLLDSLRDQAGNFLRNSTTTFTVRADLFQEPPRDVDVSPRPSSSGVPLNTRFCVRFSEPIDRNSVNETTLEFRSDTTGAVSASREFDFDDRLICIEPDTPLDPLTTHRVVIRTGVLDLQGAPYFTNRTYFFTTGEASDDTRPTVLQVSPPDGASEVGTNASLQIEFSEAMGTPTLHEQSITWTGPGGSTVPHEIFYEQDDRVVRIIPRSPLEPDAAYTLRVLPGVCDLAGNELLAAHVTTFQTTDGFDFSSPVVLESSVVNGATGIALDVRLDAQFSRPVNPITINATNCRLIAHQIGDIPAQIDLSSDRTVVTLTPLFDLPVATFHTLQLGRDITDDQGNRLNGGSNFQVGFTTAFERDSTGPALVATSPADGSENVPVNTRVSMGFDEPVDRVSVFRAGIQLTSAGGPVPGTIFLESADRDVIFAPDGPLEAFTVYTLNVEEAIVDRNGNPVTGPLNFSFTTGDRADLVLPRILAYNIGSGATGVPTDAPVQILFHERISPVSVRPENFTLTQSFGVAVPFSVEIDSTGRIVTLIPMRELQPLSSIMITAHHGVRDLAHNPLNFSSLSFTTGEGIDPGLAPTVVHLQPSDGSSEAPGNAWITATFDRPINHLSVNPESFRVTSDGQPVAGSYQVPGSVNTISFVPAETYRGTGEVEITLTGITSLGGTPMAGPHESGFTVSPSGVVSHLPGVEIVPSTQNSGWPAERAVDGRPGRSWFVSQGDASPTLDLIFPSPLTVDEIRLLGPRDFPDGFDYLTVTLELFDVADTMLYSSGTLSLPGPERDLTHTFAEVSGVRRCHFRGLTWESNQPALGEIEVIGRLENGRGVDDGVPPFLISTTPEINATDFPLGDSLVLEFTEALLFESLRSRTTVQASEGGLVTGSWSASSDFRTFTFSPDIDLPPGRRILVSIPGEVIDLAGNPFAGGSISFLSFTTVDQADVTGPSVIESFPGDGAIDVPVISPILITFDEKMSPALIHRRYLALYHEGTRLDSSYSLSGDLRTIQFSPGSLPARSTLTVVASGALQDLQGNELGSDYEFTFTTSDVVDSSRPRVLTQRPTNGAGDVPVGEKIAVFLSEPIDPSTIEGSVFLADRDGTLIEIDVTPSPDGQTLTIDPLPTLEPGVLHRLFLTPDLRDPSGNRFRDYVGHITTAVTPENRPFRVEMTVPTFNENDVPSNASLSALFTRPVAPASVDSSNFFVEDDSGTPVAGVITFSRSNRLVTFTPSSDLAGERHRFRILSTIEDPSGNILGSSTQPYFFPEAPVDTTAWTVAARTPPDGDAGASTHALVSFRSSERLNPLTVYEESFTVSGAGGTLVACEILVESDGQAFHLVPNEPLAPSTLHTVTIGGSITDRFGNPLGADETFTFTTGTGVDLRGPSVIAWTPRPGQQGVPLDTQLRAYLSEPISPVSISEASVQLLASTIGFRSGTVSLSPDRRVLSFTPDAELSEIRSHNLSLRFPIRDDDGNLLSTGFETISFTTGSSPDGAAPSVVAIGPAEGTGSVPVNARVRVEFDETIDQLSVLRGGLVVESGGSPLSGDITFIRDDRIAVFTPRSLLDPDSTYSVTLSGVRDLSGNVLAGNVVSTFTTSSSVDLLPPTVTAFTPAHTTTGVDVNVQPTIEFSERLAPVDLNPFTVRLFRSSNATDVPASVSISADGRTVTLSPEAPLQSGTGYQIIIQGGFLTDLPGNAVNRTSSSFTTAP